MIETITLTSVGGVAVTFMLTFLRALRMDTRKPRIQPLRPTAIRRTISVSRKESTAGLCRAA